MNFPVLPPRIRFRQVTDSFAGYHHRESIGENEFYHMENLTSDRFPVLAVRKKRGLHAAARVRGMAARDSLCYVEGSSLVVGGYPIDLGLSEEGPKQLVSMGAYLIILPDRMYFNTADFSDCGSLDAEVTTQESVTIHPCYMDGREYTPDYIQSEQPAAATNLALWMDTGTQPHTLKQYSTASGLWVGVESTYVKLRCPGIGKAFSQYDGVDITGLKGSDNPQVIDLEGNHVLYASGEDYLVISGILDAAVTLEEPVTVSRKMPLVDFVIEHDNRLWGCRYGLNHEGQVVNELYACKLGDFKNWNCFLGISTDSYAVSLGSDGPFTGAVTHAGHPLFFKENCLHKVFGQIPANFQVQALSCRGVQKGSDRSLAIVNEILYYKSRHGICAYDGSLPREISGALGEIPYQRAVAAALGSKYYVSLEESLTEKRSLFVYDTVKGLWHRERDPGTYLLCQCREELYCATEDGLILTLLGSGEAHEEKVSWLLETGILGGSLPERKYLVKLSLRLALEVGSRVTILAQYDSVGSWLPLGQVTGTTLRSFTIPVKPRRCDHLRLRLEGTGDAALYSITKTYTQGSDVT